jgi:cell division transport system permease protein
VVGFLVGEALRDLRRAGRVAVSAIVLITLSLAALGGFWLVSSNLDRAVARWRDRVRIVVYLRREPSSPDAAALVERVRATPGVAAVTFVGKAEALRGLKQVLGKDAGVVDQLPANPLPASLEVTPAAAAATPEGARELVARLAALPEADEVAGSVDWVEQLSHWQRLLTTIGLGVGAVLGLAAILTVTTATTLVLHARRHETEIMRLVGASEVTIRLPLLLQGMMQGLVGAAGPGHPHPHVLAGGAAPRAPRESDARAFSARLLHAPGRDHAPRGRDPARWARRMAGACRPRAMRRATLAVVLAVLAVVPAAAQTRRDDPLQAEQRKLQQTQKQLKEEKERAAAARARETSLLAELEEIERRLAAKKAEAARLEARIKKAQSDVQLFRRRDRQAGGSAPDRSTRRITPAGDVSGSRPGRRITGNFAVKIRRRAPSPFAICEPRGPGRPLDSRVRVTSELATARQGGGAARSWRASTKSQAGAGGGPRGREAAVIPAKVRRARVRERMVGELTKRPTVSKRSSASPGQAAQAGEGSATRGGIDSRHRLRRAQGARRRRRGGSPGSVRRCTAVRHPDFPEWSRHRGGGREVRGARRPRHLYGWLRIR